MSFTRLLIGAALFMASLAVQAESFSKDTAPDPVSRDVLSRTLTRLDEGSAAGGDSAYRIHRNFPQIIEQNFARLDARGMANLVEVLNEAELSDMAQLYANASSERGLAPKLLHVLAHRMDARNLGRISRHFGFAQVYGAVTAVAPGKTQDFLRHSDTRHQGPAPGELRFGPSGRFAPGAVRTTLTMPSVDRSAWSGSFRMMPAGYRAQSPGYMLKTGGGEFLNYTPYEIYLSFRTSPVGALSVQGALWETSTVLSNKLGPAGFTGYYIGTFLVLPLVQAYAPDFYNALGGTIANMVDMLVSGFQNGPAAAAQAERTTAIQMQSTPAQINGFSSWGGDYGAAADWASSYGGGGGMRLNQYPVFSQ